VAVPALQVELLTVSATANNPDLAVGDEYRMANVDTTVGEGAKSLDLKADRSLPEAVVATWKVHQLREILPTTS
jgi:hypothetical protein